MVDENQAMNQEEQTTVPPQSEVPETPVAAECAETPACPNCCCENPEPASEPAAAQEECGNSEISAASECSEAASTEQDGTDEEESAPRKTRAVVEVTQDMLDRSSKALATMFDFLGLDATVRAEGRSSKINLIVSSSETGRIIGRKGQSLDAFQLLLNRMMQKTNPDFPKIYVDIDGYSSGNVKHPNPPRKQRDSESRGRGEGGRGRRNFRDEDSDTDDKLRQQALDAAKEVRRWGEDVTLPAMSAQDRRIIHITLENEADLTTESVGNGSKKSVVISLKK